MLVRLNIYKIFINTEKSCGRYEMIILTKTDGRFVCRDKDSHKRSPDGYNLQKQTKNNKTIKHLASVEKERNH